MPTLHSKYSKAPILESVISIGVPTHPSLDIKSLEDFALTFSPRFEIREEDHNANIILDAPEGPMMERVHHGYRLENKEEQKLLLLRDDGFAFSKLRPYDNWETFFTEAMHFWGLYKQYRQVKEATRIATRSINRFDIPVDARLNAYLTFYPSVPVDIIPKGIDASFMQIQIPQANGSRVVLNQARVESPSPDLTSYIFDIDIFKESSYDIDGNDEVLLEQLQAFRTLKNDIFEACITQKTREMIK